MSLSECESIPTAGSHSHLLLTNRELGSLELTDVCLSRCVFVNVGMRGVTFNHGCLAYSRIHDGYLRQTKFIHTKLVGTRFFDCDLSRAEFEGSDLRYTDFVRCRLNYDSIIANLPTEVRIRANLLRVLRTNADQMSDYEWSDKLLVRELNARRQHNWEVLKHKTDYHRRNYHTNDRIAAAGLLISDYLMLLVWGHGIRIRNLAASAATIIVLGSTTLYLQGATYGTTEPDQPPPFLDHIYVAAASFSTLGSSPLSPDGTMARFTTTSLSLLGAVFIALLAAAVYRRIKR